MRAEIADLLGIAADGNWLRRILFSWLAELVRPRADVRTVSPEQEHLEHTIVTAQARLDAQIATENERRGVSMRALSGLEQDQPRERQASELLALEVVDEAEDFWGETYASVSPVRQGETWQSELHVSAFVRTKNALTGPAIISKAEVVLRDDGAEQPAIQELSEARLSRRGQEVALHAIESGVNEYSFHGNAVFETDLNLDNHHDVSIRIRCMNVGQVEVAIPDRLWQMPGTIDSPSRRLLCLGALANSLPPTRFGGWSARSTSGARHPAWRGRVRSPDKKPSPV